MVKIVEIYLLTVFRFAYFSGANLLANFGVVVTYESFITLGLILAVPACACK